MQCPPLTYHVFSRLKGHSLFSYFFCRNNVVSCSCYFESAQLLEEQTAIEDASLAGSALEYE